MSPKAPVVKPVSARQIIAMMVAAASLVALLLVDIGFGTVEYKGHAPAQRCAAMVMFVSVLWATDALPAYLTALSVPLLTVVLQVMCVPRDLRLLSETDTLLVPASYCNSTDPLPGHPMQAGQAAVVAAGAFFNPVILLFLCGFVMSLVLDKFNISRRMAAAIVRLSGHSPTRRLAFVMALCVVMASVLNNVPAAVLGSSLIMPSFTTTAHTKWPQFSMLGVAFACNIGGMMSPIASAQNVIAAIAISIASQGRIKLSFLDWFMVAIPFCFFASLVSLLYLRWFYRGRLPARLDGIRKRAMSNVSLGHEFDVPEAYRELPTEASSDEDSDGEDVGEVRRVDDDALALMVADRPGGGEPSTERTPLRAAAAEPVLRGSTGYGRDAGRARRRRRSSSGHSGARVPLGERRRERSRISLTGYEQTRVPVADRTTETGSTLVTDLIIGTTIFVTVCMWVLFNFIEPVFGNMGIVALVPILVFGALGYITAEDFNSLSWDTLMLLGGGLSLGTAVDSSGLLLVVGGGMADVLAESSPFVVLLAFSSLVAIMANFISSTVSAVLLLPVIASVGIATGHPKMLVLMCVFMTSGAMGLPVSSFPNANAASIRFPKDLPPGAIPATGSSLNGGTGGKAKSTNLAGTKVVENSEFIKTGFPVSFLVFILVNSVGFGLCMVYGF